MLKYIFLLLLVNTATYSQKFDNIVKLILSNNKEIQTYEQYLESISLESKFNILPSNPEINYGVMSGSGMVGAYKQELIAVQPFEFPTIYSLKSELASNQSSINQYRLIDFKKKIVLSAYNLLTDYYFQEKLISRYEDRISNYDNILQSLELKFKKSEISVLEYNKAKSGIAFLKSKLNLAKIELEYLKSAIYLLNGGQIIDIDIDISEIPTINTNTNKDSIINLLKEADVNNQLYNNDKRFHQNKLKISKLGWLPTFAIGYRYEQEPNIIFSGIQINLSIPIFNNLYKVPKAESDLAFIDIKQQTYNSEFINNKNRLYDKIKLLAVSINEQNSLIDKNQYSLLVQSLKLGQITLTEFYYENTIFYDIDDTILLSEKERYKTYNEFMIEKILSLYEN